MANLIPPMLVEIQLDVAKIKQGLTDVNAGLTNFGQTVQKQSTFLTQFKNMAAGVFGGNLLTQGMMGVQQAFKSAISDAQNYERALAKAGAIIQSTGNVAGVSVGHFQAMASSLENITTVDENLILQSLNVMATFTQVRNVVGEGNDIFDQATKAALDLSTVMEGDLQGATLQLGKALNDPIKGVGALSRVGVTFTTEQKAMIKTLMESGDVLGAQKIILTEVNREFGGAGKAVGDTFAGGVARAKDKVSDFTRNLVIGLQPILLNIGKAIGDLYNKYLAPLFGWLSKNKEAVAAFAGIILTGVVAIKVYNAILLISKGVQTAFAVAQVLMKGGQLASIASTNGLAASMLRLNFVMRSNPVGLIVTAIALLAAGFVIAWNKSETFRKVVIEVGKAGLTAFSYLIEFVGLFATSVLKIVTGPMRLLLKGLEMLGVKGAGSALKEINGAIEGVGKFFDDAAKKVKSYGATLDGLANKKISLPDFGGKKKAEDASGGGTAPETGLTKEQIKAAAALAKKRAEDIKKQNAEVVKIYEDMNKAIADGANKSAEALEKRDKANANAQKKYADLAVKITNKKNEELARNEAEWAASYEKAYAANKKTLERIDEDYFKKKAQIEKAYTDKVASLQQKATSDIAAAQISASEKLISIVQQSMDRLRSAFASGTGANISEIFKAGATSAEQVIEALKKKLQGAKDLQDNAGKLAGAGYSQAFIEQIVANGPDVGNQMATSLLGASSESQSEIQALFAQVNTISAHGVDALAATMNEGGNLATEELTKAYNQVPRDLAKALQMINDLLLKDLASANKEYADSLAEAAKIREEALAQAKKDLMEALDAADKALAEANKETMDDFNAAMEENARTLAETLAEIQLAYEEAIADIITDTNARLATLTASLNQAAAALAAFGAQKAAADALANAPTASYTLAEAMIKTGALSEAEYLRESGGGNITVNVGGITTTNSDPSLIINPIVTAIKFGSTFEKAM
jgi:hypothetical protein